MRIGVIGSGMMGSALGLLWAKAGHEVFFSSRHPEELTALTTEAGPSAKAGTVEDAARFADVVFLGVPYGAMPELAKTLSALLVNKVVLDAGNIIPRRDGALATSIAASGKGSATHTARLLPGAKVVKAFNTVYFKTLQTQAHRNGPRVGVPLASDDMEALQAATQLVADAGFDPLVVGGLSASAKLDYGSPVWNTNMTAAEVRAALPSIET